MKWSSRLRLGAVTVMIATLAIGGAAQAASRPSAKPVQGGSLDVLDVAIQWPNLDPVLDSQSAIDVPLLNSIYGQLFQSGPNGTVIPSMATKYKFSNGNLTLTLTLAKGITFTDGSAFNAAAVVSEIQRALNPANACICASTFSMVTSVTADGPYTVVLQLSTPFAAFIEAMVGTALDWIPSPTSLASMGTTKFGQAPVAAGPFTVASNAVNNNLVLNKNPNYFVKGHPYLNSITFTTIANDQSAYEALEAGQDEVGLGMATIQIFKAAKSQFNIVQTPGSAPNYLEFNTTKAPFNNILAREAVYYATNSRQLLTVVGLNVGVVTESPSGPASLFYEKDVPGYLTYNLKKAKQLVQQLGGLSFPLMGTNSSLITALVGAMDQQYTAAGMTITQNLITRTQVVVNIESGNWVTDMADMGGIDPSYGINGDQSREGSTGTLSGVRDPTLDHLLAQAAQLSNVSARRHLYFEIYARMAKEAYGPFLYVAPTDTIAAKSVQGLVSGVPFQFENVWLK